MGRAMLTRFRAQGVSATGFDVAPALSEVGTLAELVKASDVIILSLPDGRAVASVVSELVPIGRERLVVIDCSTCEPETARRASKTLAERGAAFLDAPVSGGRTGAQEGTLTILVGGPRTIFDDVHPLLGTLAKRIVHVGDVGSGQIAKLANNLLVAIHLVSFSEAVRLVRAAGVEPEELVEAINACSGRSAVSEINFPRWIASESYDSGFSMGLMRKDVRTALELASRVSLDLPMAECAGGLWNDRASTIDDEEDFNRMAALEPLNRR